MVSKEVDRPRVCLAVVGCGAVTELCHLPAAKLVQEVEVVSLEDKNLARAESLGDRFGVCHCTDDYHRLGERVDGVIVALPHYLHAPVAIHFLNRKIPVLVEKPMALNLTEARLMVDAARTNSVTLQVGLMYRFCSGPRIVKRAVEEGWLGDIKEVNVEWGFVYDWPVVSGSMFDKAEAGGGVLMDFGSHVLDLLVWLLGSDVAEVDYRDDSLGGVEAECEISLTVSSPTGRVPVHILLSRLRQLKDRFRVVGERFTLECSLYTPDIVRMWPNCTDGSSVPFAIDFDRVPRQSITQAYSEQLQSFAKAVVERGESEVPGREVLASVAIIDRCYEKRGKLEFPWLPGSRWGQDEARE